MDEKSMYKIGTLYFGILGAVSLISGMTEIIYGLLGRTLEFGPIIISGDFLLWKGLIMFFAGGFYLSSVKNFNKIHEQARTVMGSIMIWVLAGIYLISTFLGAIPGGEGRWFNTWEGFLSAFFGPYPPSLFILPFSLFILYYLRLHKLHGDLTTDENKRTVKVGEDE